MRKILTIITVIALIISVVGTGVIVFFETKNTIDTSNNGTISGESTSNS